jgi:EmrB/QacA subfamily drug resistance transporter
VLLVTSFGIFLASLDLTVVNLAFPAIGKSFPHSATALSWVLNGYSIAYAALLIPAGRLADRLGRRLVFFIGLGLFATGSAVSGLAPTLAVLVAGRVLQGIGAAALLPASLGLLLIAAPANRRAVWVAIWGAVSAIASALGPTVGGAIIQFGDWRWAFALNLPIAAVAFFWGRRILNESRDTAARPPDMAGVAFLATGVGLLALAIVDAPQWGWSSLPTIAAAASAAVALLAFVYRASTIDDPVVPLGLLGQRDFGIANLGTLLLSAGLFAVLLCQVLFLTRVWGYGIVRSGLAISPAPLTAAIVSARAGRMAQRYGFRRVLTAGCLIFSAAALVFARSLTVSPDWWLRWLPGALLLGVGVGMTLPIFSAAAVSSLPAAKFSVGSAVNQTARQLGAVLGVSILVALLGASPGLARFRDAYLLFAAWALAAACVSSFGLRERPQRAQPTAGTPPVFAADIAEADAAS